MWQKIKDAFQSIFGAKPNATYQARPKGTLAVNSTTPSSNQTDASPTVINLFSFHDPLSDIEYLAHSGMVTGDDPRTTLLLLKRINRAAYGDVRYDNYSDDVQQEILKLQQRFRKRLDAAMSAEDPKAGYEDMVAQKAVNELLTGYLEALSRDCRDKMQALHRQEDAGMDVDSFNLAIRDLNKRMGDLNMETEYYHSNPQALQKVAREHAGVITGGKYLPLARVAATSGLIDAAPAVADDLVNDVLAVKQAREIGRLARLLPSRDAMKTLESAPDRLNLQVTAALKRIADNVTPLDRQPPNEPEFEGIDQMQSLYALLTAHLAAATQQQATPAQRVGLLKSIRIAIQEYQQASMLLAYHFLSDGPAANDPRIAAIRDHVREDLRQMSLLTGDTLAMTREQTQSAAQSLARLSAQDLLAFNADHPELQNKITKLATMAGVDVDSQPLIPTPTVQMSKEEPAQANNVYPIRANSR